MMEFTYQGIVRQGFGFYNPNHAAALICAVMPLAWWLWGVAGRGVGGGVRRVAAAAAMAGLLVMLALTFSRTGVAVFCLQLLAFGLLLFFSGKRSNPGAPPKAFFLLAALALGVAVFGVAGVFARFTLDASALNRLAIWKAGLKLLAVNPLCGVGGGRSGLLATLFLLPPGVVCRTLVNSHLTLLAEYGAGIGFAYLWGIGYALLNGVRKPAAWVSFMGLCVSATMASVFDWGVLTDFSEYGGLTCLNFALSHLLLALFAGLGVYLCCGRARRRRLMISGGMALVCVALPCLQERDTRMPRVQGDYLVKAGEPPVLAYHDGSFSLKTVVGMLERENSGYRVSIEPSLDIDPRLTGFGQVMLFGACAEFASVYGQSRIVLVSPPETMDFPENTERLFLRRFPRRPVFENNAQERGISLEYY